MAGCVVGCLLASGCGDRASSPRAQATPGRTKIDACNSASSGTQVVLSYGVEKGIFAKHGLDVTATPINSGSRAVTALMAGSVQLCEIAGTAVTHAVVAGADVVIVGGLIDGFVYSLVVAPSVRRASDLKGKAIAISAAGSASETAARIAIKELGLQPDRDVAILAVGGQAERLAALDAGYVSGTVLSFPGTTLAKQKGLRVLLDMSTLDKAYVHTGISTTRAYLKANRAAVLEFMKAVAETVRALKTDREGALDVLSRDLQLDRHRDADAAALEETYEALYVRRLLDVPSPSLEGVRVVLSEVALQNPAAARFRPEDVADPSVVQELESSGFFTQLLAHQ